MLSAADELVVEAFRTGQIGFQDIPAIIESALEAHHPVAVTDLQVVKEADTWARETTSHLIQKQQR